MESESTQLGDVTPNYWPYPYRHTTFPMTCSKRIVMYAYASSVANAFDAVNALFISRRWTFFVLSCLSIEFVSPRNESQPSVLSRSLELWFLWSLGTKKKRVKKRGKAREREMEEERRRKEREKREGRRENKKECEPLGVHTRVRMRTHGLHSAYQKACTE